MVFRKKRANFSPQPTQPQFPTSDHLRTSFTAAFPDGSTFEFFICPEWNRKSGLPARGGVVQYLPKPGEKNALLQNAAREYLDFALGVSDGFKSTDGDYEMPGIAMLESDQRVADKHGIDVYDWVVHQCKWTPNVFRDPRTGARRIFDTFGLEEEVLFSVHGVLRHGLWQSTYHLSERALYIFGESHEDSKARIPLELYLNSTLNPEQAFGPGNFQAIFFNPGAFNFGKLPENAVLGNLKTDDGSVGTKVLSVAGFNVARRTVWSDLRRNIANSLPNVLDTKRLAVPSNGAEVEIYLSKTITGGGHYVFCDQGLPGDIGRRISQSDDFKSVVKEGLVSLKEPSIPDDLTKIEKASEPKNSVSGGSPPEASDDLVMRLRRLDEMFKDGVISEEEHHEHRERLLREL